MFCFSLLTLTTLHGEVYDAQVSVYNFMLDSLVNDT